LDLRRRFHFCTNFIDLDIIELYQFDAAFPCQTILMQISLRCRRFLVSQEEWGYKAGEYFGTGRADLRNHKNVIILLYMPKLG